MVTESGMILAAGDGTRMRSKRPKVLHEAGGAPLIDWVLRAMRGAGIEDIVAVVGAGADEIRASCGDNVRYALQEERLGSGHAAMIGLDALPDGPGYTFIAAGDMPLLTSETIRAMVDECKAGGLDCILLSAIVRDPKGYGRILRDESGRVTAIVEERDADEKQRAVREVNASCYCVRTELLRELLPRLSGDNAQGEYYLTDIVEMIRHRGGSVSAFTADEHECIGVNNRVQLYEASSLLYARTARRHMENGVTLIDASCTYIDPKTEIGPDTVVYPGVVFENGCRVGANVTMFSGSRLTASTVGDGTNVQNSVLIHAEVGRGCTIGPYAYLRPDAKVGDGCRIGDFVELKNCTIGSGTKVSHLTYIGDADFGRDINVGCGTVVVNYDGRSKFRTTVEDGAFIGCNTNLISPVRVGRDAYIAAGSTITDDVPPHVLAIARARQMIRREWQDRRAQMHED